MRIPCPLCGPRELREFTYRGDASVSRPDESDPYRAESFHDYVYLRDNPAGTFREYWYHTAGCHSWLVVNRNTVTHAITDARCADQAIAC